MQVLVKYAGNEHIKNRKELEESNRLVIGTTFYAVARYYKKKPTDYSTWPAFGTKEYLAANLRIKQAANDLERFNIACETLEEETI